MRRLRSWTIAVLLASIGTAAALAAADRISPPDLSRARDLSVEVRDSDGNLLRAFLANDGTWRLLTRMNDVSTRYIATLKSYEDKRFDSHFGVDPKAAARAFYQYASSGRVRSGASTLTMQVARLLYPQRKRGLVTKMAQALRAVQLEAHYSKSEILDLYLTLAPFGGNIEGVRAASLVYFGKEPKALTAAEAALLVALPQAPERVRPDRNPQFAAAARDKVLARLEARGELAEDEAAEVRRTTLPLSRIPMPLNAPQMAERLRSNFPRQSIINTSIDGTLQKAVANLVSREAAFLEDGASMAIVVAKTDTREIKAEIGGVDYWAPAGQIDLASALRSPGSALKPFIYGLAFDDLSLHPETLMQDSPSKFGDYTPKNFDGDFRGTVSARDALRMSLNVPAVMALERVGPLRFTLELQHAGVDLAFPAGDSAPSLPIALGGLGISLRDLTTLYAGLAVGGEVRPLHETKSAADARSYRLMGPAAAFYVRDILSGSALPDGWAMGQGLKRRRSIAFKTGTSYGYRDAWAVGFSNDYTVGIWVGRADGAPRADRIGREDAAPILLKVFDLLPTDEKAAPPPPADAIIVRSNDALPPVLRVFSRTADRAVGVVRIRPPEIVFPPDGAVVSLDTKNDSQAKVVLKPEGGKGPFTWIVNGAVLGRFERFEAVAFMPDGEGLTRISVIDADGRSASSRVVFKKSR